MAAAFGRRHALFPGGGRPPALHFWCRGFNFFEFFEARRVVASIFLNHGTFLWAWSRVKFAPKPLILE